MANRKVWHYLDGMDLFVIVLDENGAFCWTQMPVMQISKLEKEIQECASPAERLGFKDEPLRVEDITEVTANTVGDLILKVGDQVALKMQMRAEGVKILEEIQKHSERPFKLDVARKTRWGSSVTAAVVGLGLCALFILVFYGVDSGRIRRIHWLVAFAINIFGHYSLLIFAAIALCSGIFASIYRLVTPAEHWSLRE
jgi:hypothetical protein